MILSNTIKNILGEADYNGLSKFYENINVNYIKNYKYKWVILLTRRCVILNEIFSFALEFDSTYKSQVISDTNIDLIQKGDNVLIVDDIIIHGRAVTELYKKLKTNGVNADISAYYRLWDSTLPGNCKVLGSQYVTSLEWHELSNKLVKLILVSKIPYATFTPSYVCNKSDICIFNNYYTVEIPELNDMKFNSKIKFKFECTSNYKLLHNISDLICIREYTYNDNSSVLIPYILVSEVNMTLISQLLENKSFNSLPKCVIDELKNNHRNLAYKASLLSYVLSTIYGNTILNKDKDIETDIVSENVLTKTFSNQIITDLKTVSIENSKNILNIDLSLEKSKTKDIHFFMDVQLFMSEYICSDGFKSNNINSYINYIKTLIFKLHDLNEEQAKKGEDRLNGFLASDLITESKSEQCYMAAALILMWDIGYASLSYKEINGVAYACINDGEQAYKISLMKYIQYIGIINLLKKYQYISNDTNEYWNAYEDFIESKIDDNREITELKEAISEFKYKNLYEFNISQVKEYIAPKNLLAYTKEYINSKIRNDGNGK